ncbi:MAG TPA: TIGR02391 family protein, partial [Anaeromyxobacteraceae bacterium]|nr:TIGR02391 family protein [Anaeromyxobacteraceae bacterium]
VSVRKAAGLAATDIGTDLMRKAFNPKSGPLADQAQPEGEREALAHLFAGAIGSYKNPLSLPRSPSGRPLNWSGKRDLNQLMADS